MVEVNLKKLVQSKAPKAAKYIPNFIFSWASNFLRLHTVNEIIRGGWGLTPSKFLKFYFSHQNITYTASGIENIDPAGRYIFVSNHPFGGMDGMMLADILIDHFGDARVVVNDLLMNLTPLAPIWIPVNTLGRQNSEYARLFDEGFKGDKPLLTFPAGLCSRIYDGVIADPEWKSTFIRRAHASQRNVVPIFTEGTLHKGFYRLYRLRKALGIKAKIEMLLLSRGMFFQHGKHFNIRFGEPISLSKLETLGTPAQQCAYVRERVYDMR